MRRSLPFKKRDQEIQTYWYALNTLGKAKEQYTIIFSAKRVGNGYAYSFYVSRKRKPGLFRAIKVTGKNGFNILTK